MYGTVATGTGYMHLFVLLLMLLVQLNCGLQFLENKILFVSLASAINIRDNLLIELDTPSIDIFAVLLDVAKLHYSAKVDLAAYPPNSCEMSRLICKPATYQIL